MINALGVLGWGIGGLEAESIMLGEPSMVNVPRVIGLEVKGSLSTQATATDIALKVAESLRRIGVVDCFVELFGEGYSKLSVADRATIASMAPEYGATSVFCPVDDNTLDYLIHTGRASSVKQVELYCRRQGLFAATPTLAITYDEVVTLDLSSIRKSVAGPSRPEQRMDLEAAKQTISTEADERDDRRFEVEGAGHSIGDGDVVHRTRQFRVAPTRQIHETSCWQAFWPETHWPEGSACRHTSKPRSRRVRARSWLVSRV